MFDSNVITLASIMCNFHLFFPALLNKPHIENIMFDFPQQLISFI